MKRSLEEEESEFRVSNMHISKDLWCYDHDFANKGNQEGKSKIL